MNTITRPYDAKTTGPTRTEAETLPEGQPYRLTVNGATENRFAILSEANKAFAARMAAILADVAAGTKGSWQIELQTRGSRPGAWLTSAHCTIRHSF